MSVSSFRDLRVWQLGMEVAEKVYRLTADFPKSETYGLSSQMRRAAVSIPSNIAEGQGRDSLKNFCISSQLHSARSANLKLNYC